MYLNKTQFLKERKQRNLKYKLRFNSPLAAAVSSDRTGMRRQRENNCHLLQNLRRSGPSSATSSVHSAN